MAERRGSLTRQVGRSRNIGWGVGVGNGAVSPPFATVVPAQGAGEVERLRKVGFGTLGEGTSFLFFLSSFLP